MHFVHEMLLRNVKYLRAWVDLFHFTFCAAENFTMTAGRYFTFGIAEYFIYSCAINAFML